MAPNQVAEWHDFFLAVSGGGAAMTGLVAVALSMQLGPIVRDPVHLHRARMILAGSTAMFIRCSLAMMGGQGGRAVAVVLFTMCFAVMTMSIFSYTPVAKLPTDHRASLLRTIGGNACYAFEMLGAGLLFWGIPWGLVLAAVAMMANFVSMISGAWLLFVGVSREATPRT
ncbi:MAG: hypothetical protein JWM80_4148 [Cyanobacteria bacterium RYN_339]|nr:hypothetical protein [Cyanobacteria bacterium RYN_339]